VGGECGADDDQLLLLRQQEQEGDDEADDGVGAENVELDDQDIVQDAVEEQQGCADGVGARPAATVSSSGLPLDLEADAEDDREQAEELAVRQPAQHVAPPDVDDAVAVERGEEPDVAGQGADDRDAPDDVEPRQAGARGTAGLWRGSCR
jgi:hypothetical protein